MSDKADPSHIERTYFVDRHVSPGASIHFDRWETREDLATRCGECFGRGVARDNSWRDVKCPECGGSGRVKPTRLTIIELTECGDYSQNCLVGESNYRTIKAEFPWLVEIYGSHGYKSLAYLGKRENQSDALIEAINSLTEYSVYSDDDHSALECDRESEAWSESYGGEYDFKRALAKYFDAIDDEYEHDYDAITDELIASANIPRRYYPEPLASVWELWRDGCEAFNVEGGSGYLNEQGDSIYFLIDDWIDSARKPNYPGWPDAFKASHDALRETLARLATMCRERCASCEAPGRYCDLHMESPDDE